MARTAKSATRKDSVELRFGIELGGSRKVVRYQPRACVADHPGLEVKRCVCCAKAITALFYCKDCLVIVQSIQRSVMILVKRAGLRVRKGTPCSDCGRAWARVLDHRHYGQPYKVDPVCRSCNTLRGPAFDIPRLVAAHRRIFSSGIALTSV